MVGCSRMWCPAVAGLAAAAVGLAAVGVGLVVVEGNCPCLDGGSVVVGYGEKIEGGLLVSGDVVGSSQHTVGAAGIVDGVAVLVGGKKLVVDMVVGPVVEEDQFEFGGEMMGVSEGVHLDLGGILGDVGVEEEELVDMDGTCWMGIHQDGFVLDTAGGAWCCDAGK